MGTDRLWGEGRGGGSREGTVKEEREGSGRGRRKGDTEGSVEREGRIGSGL